MKIWRFSDPGDSRFAQAGRHGGTWQPGEPWRRMKPPAIEWEPGSEPIGDFTWPGLDTEIVVTDRVRDALKHSKATGVEFGEIEIFQTPANAMRALSERKVFPGRDSRLWDLWVTAWARLDRERSTLLPHRGNAGGEESFEVDGVERRVSSWDPAQRILVKARQPRIGGKGLFVYTDSDVFRIAEVPAWIFCKDNIKKVVEKWAFTNVSFLEMGDVIA